MGKRSRPTEPSTVIKVKKTATSAASLADVDKYLKRFRERNERNGTNERGGGSQTITDGEIMDGLRSVVASRDMKDACTKLRTFLIAYGVSRTFKGLSADNVLILKPIVQSIRTMKVNTTSDIDMIAQVETLADVCQEAKFGRNMSFATKCLNMLGGHVPIYSSEAVAYLRVTKTVPVNYRAFHHAWMAEYEARRAAYEGAAAERLGEDEMRRGLDAKWVGMRGLDVRMMDVGGPMRK